MSGRRTTPSARAAALFAAQHGVYGVRGQSRLALAHALVIGAGGLGSSVTMLLAALGVGRITTVDPQLFAPDNFNRFAFAKATDIGLPKVALLARVLSGREHLTYIPVRAGVEAPHVARLARSASIIICASNTRASRTAAARLSLGLLKPHISAGVTDARAGLAGTVSVWLPERSALACPACYFTAGQPVRTSGHSLVSTILGMVGAMVAHIAQQILTTSGSRGHVLQAGNFLALTFDPYRLEALSILARPDCHVCGRTKAKKEPASPADPDISIPRRVSRPTARTRRRKG